MDKITFGFKEIPNTNGRYFINVNGTVINKQNKILSTQTIGRQKYVSLYSTSKRGATSIKNLLVLTFKNRNDFENFHFTGKLCLDNIFYKKNTTNGKTIKYSTKEMIDFKKESHKCPSCGYMTFLKRKTRGDFWCTNCRYIDHDRDENAAKNIDKVGIGHCHDSKRTRIDRKTTSIAS